MPNSEELEIYVRQRLERKVLSEMARRMLGAALGNRDRPESR